MRSPRSAPIFVAAGTRIELAPARSPKTISRQPEEMDFATLIISASGV
jgi:hypothetical protein